MPGRAVTIALGDYLWSPAALASLAQQPSAPWTGACDSGDVLNRLLTPTVQSLVEADELISQSMKRDPRNPCSHEAAAVLVGAFQIREPWSPFFDARPALNRMAAHLAIAHVLRGESSPGPEGRIAELLLLAIAWRHDGFPERLRAYAANASEPERTWLRVISLYSVQDWRELAHPTEASLAERLAYLNALANKTHANPVLDFLDEGAKEPTADWSRFAFLRHVTVETCGTFGEVGPELAQAEIHEAFRRVRGRELATGQLVSALNEETDDGSAVRILDWPLWARFEQQNLLASLRQAHRCLAEVYGLSRRAAAYRGATTEQFGGLRLFPFLLRHMAVTQAEYQRAVAGAVPVIKGRPDLVTWSNWVLITTPVVYLGVLPTQLPAAERWFIPRLPYGTAMDYNSRFWDRPLYAIRDRALLEEARQHVFHALIRTLVVENKYHAKPPVSELKAAYGSIVEFDRDALYSIADSAQESDPKEYISAARAMCRLNVTDCVKVADYLKDHGDPEGAAREYQLWVDRARDRVAVSHGVEWLVNYYFDHGRKEEALELAGMAAGTYSMGGLVTMAGLLERMGRLTDAEEYLQKGNERYDDVSPLVEFLVRHRKEARLAGSLERIVADVFPGGPQPVRKEDVGVPRPAGVLLMGTPDSSEANAGLFVGDIVVGLDGVRVGTLQQLRVQGRLSTEPETSIIYWRRGATLEARVSRLDLRKHGFAPDPPR